MAEIVLVPPGAEDGQRLVLAPGARVEWAGWTVAWAEGGEGSGALAPAEAPPRAWDWLKAGMAIELGMAERAAARKVQDSVRAGSFQAEAAAALVLGQSAVSDRDPRLEQRAAVLLRDLAMAPTLRGAGKAARAGRGCMRTVAAFTLVQVGGFLLFTALVGVALLGLRWQGHSLDERADQVLRLVPGFRPPAGGNG